MLTLCCTQKVRDRLKLTAELAPPAPATNALGNWYVNLVRYGRHQVILATSERSLLTLVFPAKDLRESLELNIQVGLRALLQALDVPRAAIDREIGDMQFFMYGKASNRKVLGSMNEFAFLLGHYMQDTSDPIALALRLADTPMGALGGAGKWKDFGVPNDVTVELLTGRQSGPAGAH
ncbi:MAG: hypothetical protein ABI821_09005 [Pseudomonadota bacterium]